MGSYKTKKGKNGQTRYEAQVRLKGAPAQHASFTRLTDVKRWIQQTEAAIREGRHFKTTESKKHTLGQMIDRYIENVLPTKKKSEERQKTQLLWWKTCFSNPFFDLSNFNSSIVKEASSENCNLKCI